MIGALALRFNSGRVAAARSDRRTRIPARRPVAARASINLVQINVLLRERERDALLVEALLDRLGEVEEYAPVVRGLDPRAYDEVDAAVGEFRDGDRAFGLIENAFVSACLL